MIKELYAPIDILENTIICIDDYLLPAYEFSIKFESHWTAICSKEEEKWEEKIYYEEKIGKTHGVYDSSLVFANEKVRNNPLRIKVKKSLGGRFLFSEEFIENNKVVLFPFDISEADAIYLDRPNYEKSIEAQIKKQLPGKKINSLSWDIIKDDVVSVQQVYFPFYMGFYKYKGRKRKFALNGKTKEIFYVEEPPVDEEMKSEVISGFFSLFLTLIIGGIIAIVGGFFINHYLTGTEQIVANCILYPLFIVAIIITSIIGGKKRSKILNDANDYKTKTLNSKSVRCE